MENFICNQYGERFAILNTENIKVCGWITKLEAIKMQFVCVFFRICRRFDFLISQGSVATCVKWGSYCHMGFVANFMRIPAVQTFWKSVKIWQSYRQLKVGTFWDTVYTGSINIYKHYKNNIVSIGVHVGHGERFDLGCNKCTCHLGQVICTLRHCHSKHNARMCVCLSARLSHCIICALYCPLCNASNITLPS